MPVGNLIRGRMNTPLQTGSIAAQVSQDNREHLTDLQTAHRAPAKCLATIRSRLATLRQRTRSIDELIHATALEIQSIWSPIAIWLIHTSELDASENSKRLNMTPRSLLDPLGDMAAWNSTRDQIENAIGLVSPGAPVVERQGQHFLLLVPYQVATEVHWLGGIFQDKTGDSIESIAVVIADHFQLAIEYFKIDLLQRQSKSLSEVIGVGDAMANSDSIEASCITLTNRLRQMSDALQVVLVTSDKQRSKYSVAAISDVESFDTDSECIRKVRKAATLSTPSEPVQVWHSELTDEEMSERCLDQLSLKNYAQIHSCDGAINVALIDKQGEMFAAVLFAVTRKQATDSKYVAFVKSICDRLSSQFHLVQQAQRKPLQVLVDWVLAQRKRKWLRVATISIAVVTAAMLIPMPYRVGCDCEVQPVIRRFIAAPFEGTLEDSLVHNGDVVSKGQVLARMDGRKLRMELAGLEAEFEGQMKMRDSATARGNVAESQIAAKEMERLESEIGLISSRFSNLEVRSPLDGVIVSGDLDKAQGAPLELGQDLFEVAPLQRMLIEVSIPENEIKYVQPEMTVTVRLNAFPFQTFNGTVQRIHARAEIRNELNVFIAEVELPNEKLQLKPGMKGSATIQSNVGLLGWNLFHHSWDSARRWLVW